MPESQNKPPFDPDNAGHRARDTFIEAETNADERLLESEESKDRKSKTDAILKRIAPIVAERLAQQCTDAQIRTELHQAGVPNLTASAWRQLKKLAKLHLMGVLDKTPEEFRAEAVGLYDSILRDPGAPLRDKIAAQQRKDKILGLDVPIARTFSRQEFQDLMGDIDEAQQDAADS